MKKNRNKLFLKLGILFSFLALVFVFAIPKTYAYTLTEEGNIQSDNLLNINDYYNKSNNVIVENDTLTFGVSAPIVMQFYSSSMNFQTEFFPITSEGQKQATFTRSSNYYYLRIKSNYDNREVFYNINYLDIDVEYTISCLCSDYDTIGVLSNIMLNIGSIALSYEPFGIWYSQENYNEGVNDAVVDYQSSLQYYSLTPYTNSINLWSSDDLNTWVNVTPQNYLSYNLDNNYYLLSFSGLNTTKYYKIEFGLGTEQYLDYMYFSNANINSIVLNNFRFTPNINYNGTYYYFDNLTLLQSPVSSYGFIFKPTQTTYYCKYKSNGVNINYLNTSASYNKGFEEGANSQQSTIISLQNIINQLKEELNNGSLGWKGLFFAMADTPFKTVQSFLGFDVLGVNLFGAFVGFITILAILWVLKKLIK